MLSERQYGKEQPFISLGVFKLRIPFVHYGWEWPEALQGFMLVAAALGAIPLLQEILGIPFDLAITIIALNTFIYILHPTFGDPVFPGWITPAIPLVLGYTSQFPQGVSRIHAIIALQLSVAVIFTFMGITGLAKKIESIVPISMRSGIIFGAGIAAVVDVIKPGGRMVGQEITILIGSIVCYIILFSYRFSCAKRKNSFLKALSKYGMLPGMIVAAIVGAIFGEIPIPQIEIGVVNLKFVEVIKGYTIFGAPGFPPLMYFIKAIPLAISAYIIAFGDFVVAEVVAKDSNKARNDEFKDFNPNRSNIIVGIRNFIMGLFAPFTPLCGPLWAGTTIAIYERYKSGRKDMDTIYGGIASLMIAMLIGLFFLPIISLSKPILPAALSLTLVVQGFACLYIAMEMVKTREERGISGIMGIFLAFRGAGWGLVAGIVLYLIIGNREYSMETSKKSKNESVMQ